MYLPGRATRRTCTPWRSARSTLEAFLRVETAVESVWNPSHLQSAAASTNQAPKTSSFRKRLAEPVPDWD